MPILLNKLQGVSVSGEGISQAGHRQLDQIVHDIAETSYYEVTYNSTHTWRIDTEIWWTNSSKTEKIREIEYTYTDVWKISTETIKQYSSGVLSETLIKNYNYSGIFVTYINEVLT